MSSCCFCEIAEAQIVAANRLVFALFDIAPVTPLHMLVLPKRHVADYFDLTGEEQAVIATLLAECRNRILTRDATVEGFNIAVNVGRTAGQTIPHCHVHLVPRRPGDGKGVVLDGWEKCLLL